MLLCAGVTEVCARPVFASLSLKALKQEKNTQCLCGTLTSETLTTIDNSIRQNAT